MLEGMEWRKRPGEARSMRSMRRTLSDGTGPPRAAAADARIISTMWNGSTRRQCSTMRRPINGSTRL